MDRHVSVTSEIQGRNQNLQFREEDIMDFLFADYITPKTLDLAMHIAFSRLNKPCQEEVIIADMVFHRDVMGGTFDSSPFAGDDIFFLKNNVFVPAYEDHWFLINLSFMSVLWPRTKPLPRNKKSSRALIPILERNEKYRAGNKAEIIILDPFCDEPPSPTMLEKYKAMIMTKLKAKFDVTIDPLFIQVSKPKLPKAPTKGLINVRTLSLLYPGKSASDQMCW